MSYSIMRQSYNIQIATKKPISLVNVQYLAKVRIPPLSPTWAGHESEMPRLRAEAAARNKIRK